LWRSSTQSGPHNLIYGKSGFTASLGNDSTMSPLGLILVIILIIALLGGFSGRFRGYGYGYGYGYGNTCTGYSPMYDAYGNYIGQQLVNVC
jgi:Protein of unknown function (DUF3309)